MHANRRLYPRLDTALSAQICHQGESFQVQVVNLSLGGLLVEGELIGLYPPGGQGVLELDLSFDIDGRRVDTRCRLVYKRRLSFKRMVLGLHMLTLSPRAGAEIEDYISRHLQD